MIAVSHAADNYFLLDYLGINEVSGYIIYFIEAEIIDINI